MDKNAIKEIWKEYKGKEYKFPIGVLAKNVETDSTHKFLTEREIKELKEKPGATDPVSGNTVDFENEPDTRALLQSGARLGQLFPQINVWLRWLSDLGTAAWKGVSNSTNVTAEGYVADARALKTVNDKFGDMRFEREGGTIYAVYGTGADAVRKKLGSIGRAYAEAKYLYMYGSHETTWYIEGEYEGAAHLYGNCSQFNLNYAYEDYASLKIGEDFMPVISIIAAGQDYPSYGMYLPKCNVANCSATDIRLSETKGERYSYYKSFLPEPEDIEVINSNGGTVTASDQSRGNFTLYFPADGRLLVFTQQSHTVTGITVYR